jgi:hypothetical protein
MTMSSSVRKRIRALEAEIASLREALHDAHEVAERRERCWREQMERYGAPYIKNVMSKHNGYHVLHPILHAIPTPDWLDVVIGP